ncbi:hypothetical protein GCM10007320_44100 [Pseudorhodoferax aquiterrae]|uniref:RNA polymerase sigma-70 region 2 domain-containing protein n=1 Tax=Pseudorhodoferax aquiterrae TaxID=747304 RepID=A0ABQ3G6F2_9BURK|nr:sigma factor [Pseudorhodoferax aquiterrae]GHC93297.1 hypothetical protein GCM10007320_44100 [Pseudorhodoferax aquiterrae]
MSLTADRLALVEAARNGTPGAVLELMRVSLPDIRRFARRTCSTSEDAEDAVQVALWRLYRHVGALRTAATFVSWLFRIVEASAIACCVGVAAPSRSRRCQRLTIPRRPPYRWRFGWTWRARWRRWPHRTGRCWCCATCTN